MRRLAVVGLAIVSVNPSYAEGILRVCADADPSTFSTGSIAVPAGTAFDYTGSAAHEAIDEKHTSGVVLLEVARLTERRPCVYAHVKALLSRQWGWDVSPVFANSDTSYQAYGVLHNGELSTDFESEQRQFDDAAQRGLINGIVTSTTTSTVELRDDSSD